MDQMTRRVLHFDHFSLDLNRYCVHLGDRLIELRPKVFDVLHHLAQNAGRLVLKQELHDAVWPDVVVSDDSLVQCIRELRQKLDDTEHRLIKTVSRRGYLLETRPKAGTGVETPRTTTSLPARQRPKAADEQHITFCRTRDGVNIAVARVGRGRPLVCIPFLGAHLEYDWEEPGRAELLQFFADRFELIRYDGRGTGLSDRDVGELSFETLQRDLEAVIEGLGLRRYAFLGAGGGGTVGPAIAHAARHRDRVSRLVIWGGVAETAGKNTMWWTPFISMITKDWNAGSLGYVRSLLAELFPGLPPEQINASVDRLPKIVSLETALRHLIVTASLDLRSLLPRVRAPTLVLHNRRDFAQAKGTATAIPNARLVSLATDNAVVLPGEPAWPVLLNALESFLSED